MKALFQVNIQKTENHIVICTLPFSRINGLILLYITNMKFTWRKLIMGGHSVDDSLKAWEANAQFWDNRMGDDSNEFHREVIRPKVSELLDIKENDFILDIACGNGNYSAYIAEKGADVVAFDYSPKRSEERRVGKECRSRWSPYH